MRRPAPQLTLLVRGAADRPQAVLDGRTPLEAANMPALCRLARRARPRTRPLAVAPGEERVHAGADLFAALGVSLDPERDPPHAAAAWRGSGGDPAAGPAFLHLDPVHLAVTLEGSRLVDPHALDLDAEAAAALTEALNAELFAAAGGTLHIVAPHTWLLALSAPPAITTHPPEACLGGDARAGLPEGPDAAAWHRLLNEAQMVLAQLPANRERELRGAPPVNSLWAWGVGGLPAQAPHRYARVAGGGLAAAGLAGLAGSDWVGQPRDYAHWRAAAGNGAELVILDEVRQAAAGGDPPAKAAVLEGLDGQWLAPALDELRRGRLGALRLVLGPAALSGPGSEALCPGLVMVVPAGHRLPRPLRCPISERSPRGAPLGWADVAAGCP